MKITLSINAGQTNYIYEIDTDVLTLCATQPDKFKLGWEKTVTEIQAAGKCPCKAKGKKR